MLEEVAKAKKALDCTQRQRESDDGHSATWRRWMPKALSATRRRRDLEKARDHAVAAGARGHAVAVGAWRARGHAVAAGTREGEQRTRRRVGTRGRAARSEGSESPSRRLRLAARSPEAHSAHAEAELADEGAEQMQKATEADEGNNRSNRIGKTDVGAW